MANLLRATLLAGALALLPAGTGAQESPFAYRPATAGPAPGAPAAPGAATGPVTPVAAPFDINGDGRAPVEPEAVEEEAPDPAGPSTTASPLAVEGIPSRSLPVDATNHEEREALRRLLKEPSDTVRELRVSLGNDGKWVESLVDRPIVPYRTLRLDGEIDSASWNFFVTPAEAARGGTLSIAFTNSVLVLPEASRLTVYLNGQQIAQTAIDSPERAKVIGLPIAPDMLRSGENALRLTADMRHRIDCSIEATYELWTRIDTRLTGLVFPGGAPALAGLAELPGVGVGSNGATRIRVFQTDPQSTVAIDRMLRAVQAATLRGRFSHPLVEVGETPQDASPAPGTLNLAIGTARQLRSMLDSVPADATDGPLTTLTNVPALGPTVFITGPDQRSVDAALARFQAGVTASQALATGAATPPWFVHDSIAIESGQSVSLRDAGFVSTDFSGRRFKTSFEVTLPPDFYAAAYGEARVYLDGAYSGDVLPGSRIAVDVNGVKSTAVILTARGGEVFDNFPVVLSMQNFRPGVNTITIAGDLLTKSDAACLPGGTVPSSDRFALFSSTHLVFPDFARIGQLPNLASFAANGFPYSLGSDAVDVHVATASLDTVGAAGTLLARVAASRGEPLETNAVERADPQASAGVIVIAPLQETPSAILEAVGLGGRIPQSWQQHAPEAAEPGEPEGLERYDAALRRLRQELRREEVESGLLTAEQAAAEAAAGPAGDADSSRNRWFEELNESRGIGGIVTDAFRSLGRTLDLGGSLVAGEGRAPKPVPEGTTALLAQAPAPHDDASAWTVVTAPTPGLLSTSVAGLGAPSNWDRIGGRVTAFDVDTNTIVTMPAGNVSYLATMPLTFGNLRLIAANWFSLNGSIYAITLVIVAMLLAVATHALVTALGRRN